LPGDKAGKGPGAKSPGKIGGELDSISDTMKGPLDSLIESEGLDGGFDDSMGSAHLGPSVSRKFNLRRFVKNIFRRSRSKVVTIKTEDPRQVKIVLFSWGVAVALLAGVLTTFWMLSPRPASEILQKADDAATAKDYPLAVKNYDEFLKLYPKAADANDARWRRGLAVLRLAGQNAAAAGDWTPAFEVAKKEVKALPKETTDTDVMRELSVALAKIGEGLARQAEAKPEIAAVERVDQVLNMIDTDLPANGRPPDVMLEGIRGVLKPVKQKVEGRRELDSSLEAIRAAADAGDVQAAYTAYRDLLKLFPELADDARLVEGMKAVSAVQLKAVKLTAQTLAATRQERPSGLLAAIPLAVQPRKGEVSGGRGKLLFVVEQGTAYGLDAATGKTLWRRFVAIDPKQPAVTVLPLAGEGDGDAVVCDPTRRELLRIKGTTGELVWRLALAQPIVSPPVQAGKWLLTLTQGQRLELVDVATGESPRFFQLPQPVRLPPVVDAIHGLIYLAADQSNLLVLDVGQGRQVMHVGHEAGKIAAPPTVVGDFLFLPVNDAPTEAAIHIYSIAKVADGEPLKAIQTIRVPGSVAASPVALGGGVVVVTEQGGLFALDRFALDRSALDRSALDRSALDHSDAGNPAAFQQVASRQVALSEKPAQFAVSDGKTLWVADRQLTRYAIRADRIVPEATGDLGMAFIRPPRIEAGTMFVVLQRTGQPGLTAAAFDLQKNDSIWQTWIAAPLVAAPLLGVPSGKLTAVTASGGMFRTSLAGLKLDGTKHSGQTLEPILTIDPSRLLKPLVSLLPLPGEMFAMTSGADTRQIVIYDPKEQDKQFRRVLTPQPIAVGPGAFAGGLLTPCKNGQVFLLDAEARGQMARPLPPALADVNVWNWRTPLAIDDQHAVICDGDKRLTMVTTTNSDDGPALTEAAAVTSKVGLVSPLARLGKTVCVADSSNRLLSFGLPGLTQGKSQELGSRCVWGPQQAGKLVLVATENNRLFAVNEQQTVWQAALNYGPLTGLPYVTGDEIYLSSRGGMVVRISAADGKELGKTDVGCPLGTGPLVTGSGVIVGGHEGSLLMVQKP
jgi:outer membrane protein assembly factor BamB